MCGLEPLNLVGRENIVRSSEAPLVLDSRRELVPEDVVREISFCGRGVEVGGVVQEEHHPVSMHVFDCNHVVADLEEEGEGELMVSLEGGRDCIV